MNKAHPVRPRLPAISSDDVRNVLSTVRYGLSVAVGRRYFLPARHKATGCSAGPDGRVLWIVASKLQRANDRQYSTDSSVVAIRKLPMFVGE